MTMCRRKAFPLPGSYQYTYDNAGQALTQTDPFNLTLTMGYDHDGQVTSVQDSLGGTVASQYDGDGRLTSRQLTAGPAPVRLNLGHTPDGQTASLTRYKDLAGTQKVGYSALTYDYAGNLLEIQHQNGAGGVLDDFQYTYDKGDRLASENDSGTVTNYGYDYANQLTSAGSKNYTLDANGNRTMTGYSTGVQNEMLSDGTWNYTYDAEGNVLTKTNMTGGDVWTYGYDLANHLTSAVHRDSHGTLLVQVTEKYDVFGNRAEEDVYTPGSGTTVQRFARDLQGNVWADLDGNNALQTRRLYADVNGQTVPFARVSAAGGVVAWYLTDHLGSVRDITDNTGSVIDHIDYDAFGNVTNETQPTNGDRYKYGDYEWSTALSLYGTWGRFYDPASDRWLSQDPLGLGPDSNPYRYVGNAPTDAVDPSGLAEVKFVAGTGMVSVMYVPAGGSSVWLGTLEKMVFVRRGTVRVSLSAVLAAVNDGSAPDDSQGWRTWITEHNLTAAQAMVVGQDQFQAGKLLAAELGPDYLNQVQEAIRVSKKLAMTAVEFEATAPMMASPSRFAGGLLRGRATSAPREAGVPDEPSFDPGALGPGKEQRFAAPKGAKGKYSEVGGHHVHAKADFKGNLEYDPQEGFSISQDYMKSRGWDHQAMTNKQRELFNELASSGRANTLTEHSRIAEEALVAGGATRAQARALVKESLADLARQGVKVPSNIPWN
jgi:RHS repeat-associated protein